MTAHCSSSSWPCSMWPARRCSTAMPSSIVCAKVLEARRRVPSGSVGGDGAAEAAGDPAAPVARWQPFDDALETAVDEAHREFRERDDRALPGRLSLGRRRGAKGVCRPAKRRRARRARHGIQPRHPRHRARAAGLGGRRWSTSRSRATKSSAVARTPISFIGRWRWRDVAESGLVVKIGDTPADMEQGLAAGCGLVVGVTYGTHTREQLDAAGVHIIDRLRRSPAPHRDASGVRGERDAVIGAGIVGLALAARWRGAAARSRSSKRDDPQGASVRNFGTLWPIGQPAGPAPDDGAARVSRIWREVLADAGAWSAAEGSLHLAYHDDEMAVLTEIRARGRTPMDSPARCSTPSTRAGASAHVRAQGLRGSAVEPPRAAGQSAPGDSACSGWMAGAVERAVRALHARHLVRGGVVVPDDGPGRPIASGWRPGPTCRRFTPKRSQRSVSGDASCR